MLRNAYNWIFQPQFYAGHAAENHCAELAERSRWVVERIDQSQAGFAKYRNASSEHIKRGDFICRNCGNAEIEVKCLSLQKGGARYPGTHFLLNYREKKGLDQMAKMADTRVVLALFERDGRGPVPGSLRMVALDFLCDTGDYRAGRLYDEATKCLIVPTKYTRPGFEVLDIIS
jgi:hypothetical protein